MLHRLIAVVPVVLACPVAQAAEIDLAKRTPGDSITIPADSGEIGVIRILNRVPLAEYKVEVRADLQPVAPLDAIPPAGLAAAASGCPDTVKLAKELRDKTKKWTEETVGSRVAEIGARRDGCAADQNETIDRELAHTRIEVAGPFPIRRGGRLSVVITRLTGAGTTEEKTVVWTTILEGPSRGRWLTTYGVAGVADKDERFFSKTADGDAFAVAQQTVPSGYKAIPSVYFMWLPGAREGSNFSHGPTAGFGLKDDRPAFFLGYSLLYNWNIGLVAGGALVRETRLDGRYSLGQELKENLTPDSLQTATFKPRFTVSLVFRFGSNPFSGSGSAGRDAADGPTPTVAPTSGSKR